MRFGIRGRGMVLQGQRGRDLDLAKYNFSRLDWVNQVSTL